MDESWFCELCRPLKYMFCVEDVRSIHTRVSYMSHSSEPGNLLQLVGVFLWRLSEEGGVGVRRVLLLSSLRHARLGRSRGGLLG